MKATARISYKNQTILILLLFIIPYLFCLLAYNIYTANIVVNTNILQENKEKIRMISTSFEKTLSNINAFMSTTVASDYDFKVLGYNVGELNAYLSAYNVLDKCKYILSMHDNVSGFFLYSPKNKLCRYELNRNAMIDNSQRSAEELQRIIDSRNFAPYEWSIHELNSEFYLIRVVECNDAYLICIINLDKAAELLNPYNTSNGNALLFTTEDMQPLTSNAVTGDAKNVIKLKKSNEPSTIRVEEKRYLLIQSCSDLSGLKMVYLVPYRSIWDNMDVMQLSLLLTSMFCILLVPVCYYMLKRSFFSPFKGFVNTMNSIKDGNFDVSMTNHSPIREFEQMSNTFNEMLHEIKSLKIVAYEQTLEAQQATMQFLRIQIRPHFYLNCLNNLYALAQNGDCSQIQKMILILSDYLRNMFQESPYFVPLSTEVQNVEAYIELQRMTNSSLINFSTDIDKDLLDFSIPPLTILTFVENSVKFGTCPEKPLIICVKAKSLDNANEKYVNITILDNGRGFSDEELKHLNQGQSIDDLQHVGISNVKRRFLLQYNGKGIIFFSNANGACVEIFIPYFKEQTADGVI